MFNNYSYSEFKKQYRWMLKKYPETSNLYNAENCGKCVITNFIKSGSRWIKKSSMTVDFNGEFYCNTVDAIPFFRNLGGKETVTQAYTKCGYVPVSISSISSDKTQKTTREFIFN